MTDLKMLTQFARVFLRDKEGSLTGEQIREGIAQFRRFCPGVTDEEAEALALHFESTRGILIKSAVALEEPLSLGWRHSVRSLTSTMEPIPGAPSH